MTNNIYEIKIQNMACQACYGRINKLFDQLGVQILDLNLKSKDGQIAFDHNQISQKELENQLNQLGYQLEWK